ncbi:MAG: hypothetical protein ACHREM_01115 [Polyangiales bacterium]
MSREQIAADRVLQDLGYELREMLCVFESFRRLGFTSDQIFAAHDGTRVSIVLQYAGGLQFVVRVGETQLSEAAFKASWEAAAVAWNLGSEAVLDRLWSQSDAREQLVPLVSALRLKGVPIVVREAEHVVH